MNKGQLASAHVERISAFYDLSPEMIGELQVAYLAGYEAAAPQWIPVESAQVGVEVIGFNESWVDLDYNPNGTCICFKSDDGEWTVVKWCGYHDEYHVRIAEVEESGRLTLKAPTHVHPLPQGPSKPQ